MSDSTQALDAALDALLVRRPGSSLEDRARARLAEVLADPSGQHWMESAGLLDGDSCGYPVEGGYYDTKSELAAAPGIDEAAQAAVLARLVQEWADDYVLTGQSRLDRSWRQALGDVPPGG